MLNRALTLLEQPRMVLDRATGNRLRILMFHSIADNAGDPHALAPARFRALLARLAGQYRIVSLAEGAERLRGGKSLQRRLVLTFDDGYRDFLTNALPVLQELRLSATL